MRLFRSNACRVYSIARVTPCLALGHDGRVSFFIKPRGGGCNSKRASSVCVGLGFFADGLAAWGGWSGLSGDFVKRHFSYLLPALIGAAMFISSCGTTGLLSTPDLANLNPMDLIPLEGKGPRTFLAGAKIQDAKALAMGSAVSKGWKIAKASDDRLLIVRPLGADAAEVVVGEPISRAAVEVKTDFNKRRGGVAVVASAAVIADKVTAEGKRSAIKIDFTESYKDELNLSLDALRQSWEENRQRIAAATRPPLPTKKVVPKDKGTKDTPDTTADRKTATAVLPWPGEDTTVPVTASNTDTAAVPVEDRTPADRKTATAVLPWPGEDTTVPVTASNTDTAAVPVEDRTPVEDRAISTPPPIAPSTVSADAANNVPILKRTGKSGRWARYADSYAKVWGCERSGNETTLEYEHLEFELHRIYCKDRRTFLVGCNAGFCRIVEEKYTDPIATLQSFIQPVISKFPFGSERFLP